NKRQYGAPLTLTNEAMGSTQSIMVGSDGELYGASDSRLVDDLTAGY
ncbi:gamma-glutamyltranspeptidase, partial [Escherichia coli]